VHEVLNQSNVNSLNTTPLFSIITVCLNCKSDLANTASGLLNQTFTNYEYIIKDGGSTDGTQSLINKLDADIAVSAPDNGVFDAMNQALELSNGEFVFFLNAGDLLYDNDVLERIAAIIDKSESDIDFFYGDIVKPYARRQFLVHPEGISEYYLFARGLCHQSWFLRRKVYIQSHGFSNCFRERNIELGGDYYLLLEIFLNYKIKAMHIPEFIAVYKGGGISQDLSMIDKRKKYDRKIKKRQFGPLKYSFYQSVYIVEQSLKSILYDKYVYLLFRKISELQRNLRKD
jgi:putative colanic acid biosynthesis glycosyltransferase